EPARGRRLGRALFHWHGLPAPFPHQLPSVSHVLAGHGARPPQSRPRLIVYVSGATGFVGSHVARELREQGAVRRDRRRRGAMSRASCASREPRCATSASTSWTATASNACSAVATRSFTSPRSTATRRPTQRSSA